MKKLLLLATLFFAASAFAQAAPDVSKTAALGTPVKLQFVSSNGTPPYTFQWQKNGVNIAGATASILDLGVTTQSSAAVYTLIVSDAKGSAVSNRGILSITITVSPTNVSIGFVP